MSFKAILVFLFCFLPPLCQLCQAAIAITPPDHFVGDGTLDSGTVSPIKVNIIDEEPGIYYLKSYFYPPSNTQARFGYVWNPTTNLWISTWQKNSEQLQIEVAPNKEWNGVPVEGLWQGEVSIKTDIKKSGYLGYGEYILKVRATPVTTGHVIEISTKTSIIKSSAEPTDTSNAPSSQSVSSQSVKPSPLPTSTSETVENSPPPTEKTSAPSKEVVYPKNIFINEILPSPEGADVEQEWIEIYNANNFEVDLSGWQIRDKVGQTMSYRCPTSTKIASFGFFVLPRAGTKITLQNSGDTLELLNPNGEIVHQANYPKAPIGQSYNRTPADWQWSTTVTAGKENIISQPLPSKSSPGESWKGQGTQNGMEDQGATTSALAVANIQKELPASSRRLLTLFLAVFIAIGSIIIVLFLKKNPPSQ